MSRTPSPPFSIEALPPGTRLAVAVSGGADSVALLRLAHSLAGVHGWALRVLHVQHGLRGEDSQADAVFVQALAAELSLPCQTLHADAGALARERRIGVEEAGRLLRYGWFGRLLDGTAAEALENAPDAIATGHTLDDQAETVLARLLRGAWTAGLAGIYPVIPASDLPGGAVSAPRGKPQTTRRGVVVRPLLGARRDELRAWLGALGQDWREDASNQDLAFTRNRLRHRLLPALVEFNPQVAEQLAQVSVLAREDERYWQGELARLLPGLLLPGRPVRGGGRASSTLPGERSLAIEVERLRALPPALQRRVVRAAAAQLAGAPIEPTGQIEPAEPTEPTRPLAPMENAGKPDTALGFAETARVLSLLEGPVGSTPRREQLSAQLRAERTPRELRLVYSEAHGRPADAAADHVPIPVPGEGAGLGVQLRIALAAEAFPDAPPATYPAATLRAPLPGDRVRLRYSSGAPRRVKEVLERMGVPPPDRADWPVLEWQGELVWLRGAVLEPTPLNTQLAITEESRPEQPPPATG